MKKFMICLLLAALIAAGALAESAFSFRNGIAWGMSPEQVMGAEGNPSADTDHDAGFDILEIEDLETFGAVCDIEYFFKNGALLAAACAYEDADPAAAFSRLSEAVTAQYGAMTETGDTERWQLMEDILDGEMENRAVDAYACWEVADGTFIALVEDAGDGSVGLYFYNETAVVETAL